MGWGSLQPFLFGATPASRALPALFLLHPADVLSLSRPTIARAVGRCSPLDCPGERTVACHLSLSRRTGASRRVKTLWLLLLLGLLSACAVERPAPVLKVGLLAPFEGERREQGYHLLPAIRAATPERVRGQRVEWVILDTHGDPQDAVQRARELLVDREVQAIIGPLLPEEVAAVAPLMEEAQIAWWPLAPEGEPGVEAWRGSLPLGGAAAWGAAAWPAIQRGEVAQQWMPALPDDAAEFASAVGETPWPEQWLAWQATRLGFQALDRIERLERGEVRAAAEPLRFPPPQLYVIQGGAYPGVPAEQPPLSKSR